MTNPPGNFHMKSTHESLLPLFGELQFPNLMRCCSDISVPGSLFRRKHQFIIRDSRRHNIWLGENTYYKVSVVYIIYATLGDIYYKVVFLLVLPWALKEILIDMKAYFCFAYLLICARFTFSPMYCLVSYLLCEQ